MPSQNAFHIVGVYGLNDLLKVLLSRYQDIDPARQDKFGRTPLSYAAEYGRTEVVKTLLCDERIDPDRQDNRGRTPLSYAAANGHTEIVKTLLCDDRVDPDRQDEEGRTPLSYAARCGFTEAVRTLLSDSRVNLDRQDNCGRTPLSWTIHDHTEVVEAVLSDSSVRSTGPAGSVLD